MSVSQCCSWLTGSLQAATHKRAHGLSGRPIFEFGHFPKLEHFCCRSVASAPYLLRPPSLIGLWTSADNSKIRRITSLRSASLRLQKLFFGPFFSLLQFLWHVLDGSLALGPKPRKTPKIMQRCGVKRGFQGPRARENPKLCHMECCLKPHHNNLHGAGESWRWW